MSVEDTAEQIVMVVGDILRNNPTNIKGAEQAVINQLRAAEPTFFCSCGAALTKAEYAKHVKMGHDQGDGKDDMIDKPL